MRLLELHLKAFGPFTDHVIALGDDQRRLVLVHGLNEAGKSSTLRAITALRYGFPNRSEDAHLHDYASLRVGGVFADAEGHRWGLMRRKGKGVTLKAVDFAQGGAELPEAVPGAVQAQLTAGLQDSDHDTLFGLDHARLREGGAALERGDGELGAALFEASSGAVDVKAILGRLHDTAREYFNPSAQSRTPKFNVALAQYRRESERHRNASVRASRWDQLQREWGDAQQALDTLMAAQRGLRDRLAEVRELIAVSPTLGELSRCEAGLTELADARLLDENAAAERSTAAAGLSDARADALVFATRQAEAETRRDAVALDTAVLGVADAITELKASVPVMESTLAQEADARAAIDTQAAALALAAQRIDPALAPEALARLVPPPAARVRLLECLDALGQAEQALALQRDANALELAPVPALAPLPDAVAVSALRQAMEQATRQANALERLPALALALQQQRREADTTRASLGLADEAAVRAVVPLLGAAIDQAAGLATDAAAARKAGKARAQLIQQALAQQQDTIATLTEHGDVPTLDDVSRARVQRGERWAALRARYIDGVPAERDLFSQAEPVVDAFEAALARADGVVDGIVGDHERASRLSAARRKVADLERESQALVQEEAARETAEAHHRQAWTDTLARAGMPNLAPSLLRDWQARHAQCLARLDAAQAVSAELEAARQQREILCGLLQAAVNRLALTVVGADESLETLQAVALDDLREVAERHKAREQAAGQKQQRERQQSQRDERTAALTGALAVARAALDRQAAAVQVAPGESIAVCRARLAEFDALQSAVLALAAARQEHAAAQRRWQRYIAQAEAIALALGEEARQPPHRLAGPWLQRLEAARQGLAAHTLAVNDVQSAGRQGTDAQAKAERHQATLHRLCLAAGVTEPSQLPEAEALSQRKRGLLAATDTARQLLAAASRRSRDTLEALRAGRDAGALQAEEAELEARVADAESQLAPARAGEETARHALAAVDASDEAAEAADAMEREAAAMRNILGLQMRYRLAHGLLQEAMRRFKQRTQAPMLTRASAYFAKITGGLFSGIGSDDSEARPVIVGLRAEGKPVHVAAMSEGTRDQLYLALRLAALDLQRERGVALPLVLDDVLMTSDDHRAACILRALARFSRQGQVIVFTHHRHLCDVARAAVPDDQLAVVELSRGGGSP